MSLLFRALSFARPCARSLATKQPVRHLSTSARSTTSSLRNYVAATVIGLATATALSQTVHLDASAGPSEETVVDPDTSITFPKVVMVPSKANLPPVSLIGLGVRTVSFLGIKVYSVGFYADLTNPNLHIPKDMSPEDKIQHIVENTSCVVRLVPTRSTSYTHLRDAFMRALQERMGLAKKAGNMTEDKEYEISSPMLKLKSLFPNSPLTKHTPLDIYLTAPVPGKLRSLIFRDMGSIDNDWVATEFVLHYFEGAGPSPPLKKSVLETLKDFSK